MTESSGAASLETKDQIREDAEFVRTWLDAIELSSKEEEKWRKRAEEATNIYRSGSKDNAENRSRTFNILFANVDTTVPSIYNSTPVPDVRRRYNDEDKVGKQVSDIIERAISYSVDAYDFDAVMKDCAKDTEIAGRATARVRYVPYFAGEEVVGEEATCEHVQWKDFRRGPGKTWDDVPWIAFRHYLNRAQLRKLNKEVGNTVNLDSQVEGLQDKGDGKNESEIFKRATVWEIWDKDSREVIFIAESYKEKPLVREADPLGLTTFFPVPRPIYAIKTSDSLCPVVPYDTYRDQAEELEHVSRRIMALVEALKAKGIYDGRMEEVITLATADDNEMIPVASAANYLDGAGLEKAIAWWPIETISRVLKELYLQREQIKQAIYEITGLSDILRGQSDPNETLGAQELKKQTGSLRIQSKQADVQRFARDIFRLKAEIIATKFSWETISMMTGINFPSEQEKQAAKAQLQQMQQQGQATGQAPQIPPQVQDMLAQPSREEIQKVLKDDTTRAYRIDVESDSTIRADMTRNQNNMNMFLQGTAQYAAAMGPIVQLDKSLMPTVIEVYSAFARTYKLGKQAEDALDKLSDQGKQMAENPQPEKPDPKLEAEKIKADALKEKTHLEGQLAQQKFQHEQEKAQLDMRAAQMKHAAEMEKIQADLQAQREEIALMREKLGMEMQAAREKNAIDAEAAERDAMLNERTAALQAEATEHKHTLGMEAMAAKAKAAKSKPANGARK